MNLHREVNFEREICEHLAAHGWLYAEGDAQHYDRTHALYLPDLLAWIEATQPDSWERLNRTHGPATAERLAACNACNMNSTNGVASEAWSDAASAA